MLAHIDPCGAKRSEKNHERNSFNQHNNVRRPGVSHRGAGRKKKSQKIRNFKVGDLGAILAQFGAVLAHLRAMLAHLGRYVGPSWGLCLPILRPMLAMLTHLEPQDPKNEKKCEEQRL